MGVGPRRRPRTVKPGSSDEPIAANAALLTLARLSTVVALFAATVLAARLLSPAALGLVAVGQTIGTVAALVANGGLNISTIYFLRRAGDEYRSLTRGLVFLAICSAAAAFLLVLISAPVTFGAVLGAPDWPLLVAAGLLASTTIAFEFAGALLLGGGSGRAYVVVEAVRGWGAFVGVAVLLGIFVRGADAVVSGMASGFALASMVGLAFTARQAPLRPRYDRALTRAALAFGVRGQVGNVLQFLGVRVDLLLVPALLDLQLAGIYFVAVRVSDLVGQVGTAAASFVFPVVAGQEDRDDTAVTEQVIRTTMIVTVVSGLLLGVAGGTVIPAAFGEEYAAALPSLWILLVAVVPLSVGRLLAADLKGRGRPGLVSISGAVSVAASLALDLVLVPAWGIVGAAVASVLAYSLTTAVLLVVFRGVTGGRVRSLIPGSSDLRLLSSRVADRLARRV